MVVEANNRGIAIKAGGLFDGDQWLPGPALVVVRGGRIQAVDTLGSSAPDDCELVDYGSGASILPGMIDAHSHLSLDSARPMQHQLVHDSDRQLQNTIALNARRALSAGVTTIRDLGDRQFSTTNYVRRQKSGCLTQSPFVISAGPPITSPGGHCWFMGGEIEGKAGLATAVRQLSEHGTDLVKVMASGGMGSAAHASQFDQAALTSLVQIAAEYGLKVVAHAHALHAIADSVEAGVWGIEHCTFMTEKGVSRDERLIEKIATKGIYVGCTVAKPRADMPASVLSTLEPYWDNNAYMYANGVNLVCCTDAGINPVKTHDVLPSDMAFYASQVASTAAALRSVTTIAAASCCIANHKGAIRPGMDADLVVVDGNPIDDIRSLLSVHAVYRDGILVNGARDNV